MKTKGTPIPRDFDSDEVHRGQQVLRFTERVDCPACNGEFEAEFMDSSMSVEDMDGPPAAAQTCPHCGHSYVTQMSGWSFFSEAG